MVQDTTLLCRIIKLLNLGIFSKFIDAMLEWGLQTLSNFFEEKKY